MLCLDSVIHSCMSVDLRTFIWFIFWGESDTVTSLLFSIELEHCIFSVQTPQQLLVLEIISRGERIWNTEGKSLNLWSKANICLASKWATEYKTWTCRCKVIDKNYCVFQFVAPWRTQVLPTRRRAEKPFLQEIFVSLHRHCYYLLISQGRKKKPLTFTHAQRKGWVTEITSVTVSTMALYSYHCSVYSL